MTNTTNYCINQIFYFLVSIYFHNIIFLPIIEKHHLTGNSLMEAIHGASFVILKKYLNAANIVRITPLKNGAGGEEVNFNYLPRREVRKIKKGVKVWCRGKSS